ncbi:alanine racemase [Sphingomonas vulcanisoli]|uniref:Alanine racemase n=1 Tax=Sphingomonas vulcanisoli TaxID=1658060 RepID=A0ABX0TS18_9SPHN|nr:alanine racemase [Sphingomonas vulcanisoli]NIJ08318.1 alanine racemase [Sphingomonas vulcanisoli]
MVISEASAGGRLTIDLGALKANYRRFAALAARDGAACGAVVKADAYGLGVERVVPALLAAGCRTFFVVQLDEARVVRPLLPDDVSLYVLNGLYPGSAPDYPAIGAIPVLNSLAQAREWAALASARGERLPAALQFDTIMSRLGMPPEEVEAIASEPGFRETIDLKLVMSHLACSEDRDAPANARQLRIFEEAAALFPDVSRSLANSGGTVLGGAFAGDLVRVGIALYGGIPTEHPNFALERVVSLDAKVIQLRTVPPGTGVGYGLTFTTTRETRIATLGLGYADGWLRSLSGRGAAYYGGQRLPILGRVSMDSMAIDVTDLPPVSLHEGDWVELIGPHQSLDEVGAAAGTISYEILTSLGARYHVRVIDEEAA